MDSPETIFATATGPGKAGVAIIRISGALAWDAVEALGGGSLMPRYMSLRRLQSRGEVIDHALVVVFEAGSSFTGEPVGELHVHGGRSVVARLLDVLGEMDGLRLAEPGEFTRRAVENGMMDLLQAEGLADLIDAETESQRRQALALSRGSLTNVTEAWRGRLIEGLALLEASIDFADEDDAPVDVSADVDLAVSEVAAGLRHAVSGADAAARVREGYVVALVGPPNAGKSTLLNAIAGRDVALTSGLAGTTRDAIEVACDVNGLAVTFVDLAGIRDTDDTLEAAGVALARRRAADADMRIFLGAADTNECDLSSFRTGDVRVMNKSDIGVSPSGFDLSISAQTGSGVSDLLARVGAELNDRADGASLVGHIRQRNLVESALGHVEAAMNAIAEEVKAELLRAAAFDLSSMIGAVSSEQVLDEIFSRFCMGK